jgi:hypothetical protein
MSFAIDSTFHASGLSLLSRLPSRIGPHPFTSGVAFSGGSPMNLLAASFHRHDTCDRLTPKPFCSMISVKF